MITRSFHRAATTLAAAALGAAALAPGAAAAAGSYPAQPIRLIVPYAAGGGPDVLARKTADALAKVLKANVIVENKVGAGGILAGEYVARAQPDGYTLMQGASSHVVQKILQPTVNFDPLADFTHIVRDAFLPQVLVVRSDAPYQSVQELIAAARKADNPFNFASGGIGSAAHLAGAAFSDAAKAKTVHVPYRGSVEIVPSLLRGDVQFAFPVASTALAHIADGKVRPLAVTAGARLPQLPDVPTLNEVFDTDALVLDAWSGVWAPKGLSPEITATLEKAFKEVYAQPEIQQFYAQAGAPMDVSASPAEFTQFIKAETAKYQKIIDDNGIKVDQ